MTQISKTTERFIKHYRKFWKRIYRDDAYTFMKDALLWMQNTFHNKFHMFFSEQLTLQSIKGCRQFNIKKYKILKSPVTKTRKELLCTLIDSILKGTEAAIQYAPKSPEDVTVYRVDPIKSHPKQVTFNFFPSTSLSPEYVMDRAKYGRGIKQLYMIDLPKGHPMVFYNIPFTYNGKKSVFEFEVKLPKRLTGKVLEHRKINKYNFTWLSVNNAKSSKEKFDHFCSLSKYMNKYLYNIKLHGHKEKKVPLLEALFVNDTPKFIKKKDQWIPQLPIRSDSIKHLNMF